MFCLRSWIPILFFLSNASPLYLLLFLSATYFLNRPCVYCSLLLAILVICLFDFQTDWFEPRPLSYVSEQLPAGSSTLASLRDAAIDGASAVAALINSTASGIAGTINKDSDAETANHSHWGGVGFDWVRSLVFTREWKIPCVDAVIRL